MTTRDEIAAALRRSVKENQRLLAENAALRARSTDPIAVVSMACRLPGGARTPEDMWRIVYDGMEVVSSLPEDRGWDLDGMYDPVPGRPGRCYTRRGGFLDCIAEFDPVFFGISPREAVAIDPVQRLLLETAWETLERAAVDPQRLRDSKTGVFAGVENSFYYPGTDRTPTELAGYATLGNLACVVSGRISYLLGLRGPAITVETACSSSLTAIHLAVQALRAGECDLALAGGGTVMGTPEGLLELSIQQGLAADGRCKPFSASADGTVLSEGVGMVLLARKSHADRMGYPILAMIRGSAINHDGASNGLTAPNGTAQREVIRAALADGGLAPAEVDVVEAHGTGTRLGDPIEADALLDTYGRDRAGGKPLLVGSLKSNFGHPQAAAGVAGVIKMVLAMRAGWLPATLYFDGPSPYVDWSAGAVQVLGKACAWPDVSRPRRAGVSSFGISGTNVHLILEQVPEKVEASGNDLRDAAADSLPHRPLPFALSAKNSAALRAQAAALRTHLDEYDSRLSDVAFSLATTRTQFDRRAVVTAHTRDELRAGLNAIVDDLPHATVATATVQEAELAFVFAGQGTQRVGMGAELYERYPVFATTLDEICGELDRHLEQPVREVMFGTHPECKALLDCTRFLQPALFAFEAALYALLRSWGVQPTVLVGHSIGELTAAYVAGVWALPDAAALVTARGRLMGELPGCGAMAALQSDEQQVLAALSEFSGRVEIAAVNGPSSTVVAGDEADVLRLVEQWKTGGHKATVLRVSHAFHSAQLDPMLAEFGAVVSGIEHRAPQIRLVSCLEPDADLTQPTHWVRQARHTVRFCDGVRMAHQLGAMTFVDLGPDGSAAALAGDCLGGERSVAVIPAVRADSSETWAVQTALARIHTRGSHLDWDAVFASEQPQRVALPTYAFERQRYWWHRRAVPAPAAGIEPAVEDRPDRLPEAMPRSRLESVLKHNLAAVAGITDLESVELTTTFRDFGLNSVGVVELRRRLEASLGLGVPSTFVFDYPTPAALLEHLGTVTQQDQDAIAVASAQWDEEDDHRIAIVGMACRYPGGVTNADDLWDLVANGVDAIGSFPHDRGWPRDIYHPDPDHSGTSYTREGGFLEDVAGFDAAFFGISDREALAMDPQQRLLLETAWEALEDAGVDPASVRGTDTGVFVGIAMQDYQPQAEELVAYRGTAQAPSVASGRIAYVLGTQGPVMTVDTACSSSLVALHMAAQSLRSRESNLALVGGATVLATPDAFVAFSRQRGIAPDGRCKAFGAGADGTGWAEGAGMLLLERVCDARRLAHPILALVRGSAVNADGASNGLTAPNGVAQQRVIRTALANAGLRAEDVDLIEAHGTGTALGDPVEAGALLATYGAGRSPERPIWLGSLKSNIGHSMAAAGVGGVIKVVEAMRNGRMPKTLHADPASPHVDWSAGAVRLLTDARPWPEPRRAAVSAFGVSGTNAHVILEHVASTAHCGNDAPLADVVVVPISGHSPAALRAQARRLHDHVTARPDLTVAEIGWSAATTRCALRYRAVVIAISRAELVEGLSALADGATDPRVVTATARSARPAFVAVGPEPHDGLIKLWQECGVVGQAGAAAADAMGELLAQGHNPVIQLGSDRALTDELRRAVDVSAKRTTFIVSPAIEKFGRRDFLYALAQAHAHGVALDWRYIFGDGIRRVKLPTYAFQRSRYWVSATSLDETPAEDSDGTAPVTGTTAAEVAPVASVSSAAIPARVGREQLLDHVVGFLAGQLGVPACDIDHDEGFFQLGLDSLAAAELRKHLEGAVGIELPGTLLFEQPNVTALVDWLTDALNVLATSAPAAAAAAPVHDVGPPQPPGPDMFDGGVVDLVALLDAEIERSRATREKAMK